MKLFIFHSGELPRYAHLFCGQGLFLQASLFLFLSQPQNLFLQLVLLFFRGLLLRDGDREVFCVPLPAKGENLLELLLQALVLCDVLFPRLPVLFGKLCQAFPTGEKICGECLQAGAERIRREWLVPGSLQGLRTLILRYIR